MKTLLLKLTVFTMALYSHHVFAADDVSKACGLAPSGIGAFFSDAEEIHRQCVSDFYEAQKLKAAELMRELNLQINVARDLVKENAYRSDNVLSRVTCKNPSGADVEDGKRCEENLQTYRALVSELDKIMGWDRTLPKPTVYSGQPLAVVQKQLEFPCPDADSVREIQKFRFYHKKMHALFMHCKLQGL